MQTGTRRVVRRHDPPARLSNRKPRLGQLRVLVVVDGTDASRQALHYVGRVLAGCGGVDCHLANITPGLPPELLESGGSELPEREAQIEADLRAKQRRWIETSDRQATEVLRAARATLQRAGVPSARIHTCGSSRLDAGRTVDEVLRLARREACGTVAVGHHAHTWFRGLGGGHLAEQLVRRAKGLAVWVVD